MIIFNAFGNIVTATIKKYFDAVSMKETSFEKILKILQKALF